MDSATKVKFQAISTSDQETVLYEEDITDYNDREVDKVVDRFRKQDPASLDYFIRMTYER